MPAEIVNLNKARKAKARLDDKKQSQENRAKSGQSKAARAAETLGQSQRDRLLDGAKRDGTGESKSAANDEPGNLEKTP